MTVPFPPDRGDPTLAALVEVCEKVDRMAFGMFRGFVMLSVCDAKAALEQGPKCSRKLEALALSRRMKAKSEVFIVRVTAPGSRLAALA
jgi:hypothetical protein